MVHSSKLPETTTTEQAIAMLRDHEFFLHCDPHMSKFQLVETDSPPPIPEKIKGLGETKSYQVTDVLHTLPAGLWDSNVVSTYEFTDISDGLFVRIRSPLSVVMETVWTIKGEDGQLELVEDVSINCSRLLVGVVRSQCESGWQKIHEKMIDRLKEGPQKAAPVADASPE
jgi:hypothetical protein